MKYLLFALAFFLTVSLASTAAPRHCYDSLLVDGLDELQYYALDTSNHWIAITKPFTSMYRVIIDGIESKPFNEISPIKLSSDGYAWAFFGYDNLGWNLITRDSSSYLPAGCAPGEICFSPDGSALAYSYFDNTMEYFSVRGKEIRATNKSGQLFLNTNGYQYAYIASSGSRYVVNINGRETTSYDTIVPFGFWHDNKFLFAARNGYDWKIYKNDKEITEPFQNVSFCKINRSGTVAAAIVGRALNNVTSILISDQFYEPLYGMPYENAYALVLHPELAIASFVGTNNGYKHAVMNTIEMPGGEDISSVFFTHNGEDNYYLVCGIDCSLIVNGKKFPLSDNIYLDKLFARKPGSNTFAYTTSSTLVMRYLENPDMLGGRLMDEMGGARYNRLLDRYEALGRIGNRLYLLWCTD